MEDIKDEENSDSSLILSDCDSESDIEESLQEEQNHIESFGNNWEEINERMLDNRNENSIINNINLNYLVDFFCLLFKNDLLNKIIEYTNIYANNKFSKAKKTKKKKMKKYKYFVLKAFIGIIIAIRM